MRESVIHVENLGKQYHIGRVQQHSRFGEQIAALFTAPLRRAAKVLRGQPSGAAELDEAIWALRGVNFIINPGEVVGIIGRNGAGKSTLLKILSRITEPTEGFAEICGRVGSLLEVGTGFHPELTGRENVFLNGAILGMKAPEIQRKFSEIVAFAELENFIDTPVKHYSTGMYTRLAFSVAAHLETELLLVDEVLAVGDTAFQKRCIGKMSDIANEGRTVLFVSHNLGLVQSLCQRGIFIEGGSVQADGTVKAAVEAYLQTLEQVQSLPLAERTDRHGVGKVRLIGIEMLGDQEIPTSVFRTGESVCFIFHLSSLIIDVTCIFVVFNELGQAVTVFKSDVNGPDDLFDPNIGAKFICEIDCLLLLPGRYHLNVFIRGRGERQDWIEGAIVFDVEDGHVNGRPMTNTLINYTSVTMPHRWKSPVRL